MGGEKLLGHVTLNSLGLHFISLGVRCSATATLCYVCYVMLPSVTFCIICDVTLCFKIS